MGAVTGTPTTAGTFSFTINVSDLWARQPRTISITVSRRRNGNPDDHYGYSAEWRGRCTYQQAFSASGACNSNPFGGGSVNWTIASGALPNGLGFATVGTGATISGTPTAEGSPPSPSGRQTPAAVQTTGG